MKALVADRTISPSLLDVTIVAQRLGISIRHVWRLNDRGAMPPSFKLAGSRCVRWHKQEIDAWIEAGCPARRYAAARTA